MRHLIFFASSSTLTNIQAHLRHLKISSGELEQPSWSIKQHHHILTKIPILESCFKFRSMFYIHFTSANKCKPNSRSTYLKKEMNISFLKKILTFHQTKLNLNLKVTLTSMYLKKQDKQDLFILW